MSCQDSQSSPWCLLNLILSSALGVHQRGTWFGSGTVLAELKGPHRPMLAGERTALNLLQRMSGIATATAAFVEAVAGTRATIVDTRKTAPGLRILDKYAVRCGGGSNHRFSLSDGVLAKDNHLALYAQSSLADAIQAARRSVPHTIKIEVEVDRLDQIEAVLSAGQPASRSRSPAHGSQSPASQSQAPDSSFEVDILLLDNMTLPRCGKPSGSLVAVP